MMKSYWKSIISLLVIISGISGCIYDADQQNQKPVANNQTLTAIFNTPIQITLTGSDKDGDRLTFSVNSQPENGQLIGIEPTLTYTPNQGFDGTDSFTFRVFDGLDYSATATVTFSLGQTDTQAAVSATQIKMIATTASDKLDGVEYFFKETYANHGATNSGWQTSPAYTDRDLSPNTTHLSGTTP